ncbi:MAG: hypothetical protein NVS9B3_08630 [Gemmatimonadaceae bacterium]
MTYPSKFPGSPDPARPPAPAEPRVASEVAGAGREGQERRRRGWADFRQAYPGILTTMTVAAFALVAVDGWLIVKRVRYEREISRLRAGMTDFERRRTDMAIASEQNKFRVMVELVRRQALGDKNLHVAVALDSGRMTLEREGAFLRQMPMRVGAEKRVGIAPDTVHLAVPRGTRTLERVLGGGDAWEVPRWVYADRGLSVPPARKVPGALGPVAIVLNGGTVVYSLPSSGPLADSAYVLPGSIRANAADLKAISPNLKPGMLFYFY